MAGEDLQSFRIDSMSMGAPLAPPAPAPVEGDAAPKDAGYPTLEGIVQKKSTYKAFSQTAAATVANLQQKAASGGGDDARKALAAYGHLTDTLSKLVELTVAEVKRRKQAAGK